MSYYTTKRLQLEAQRTANTREQADLRTKLFNSLYPHHKTEEGQKMILDLLASSERVGLQIKAELEALRGLDRGVQNYF